MTMIIDAIRDGMAKEHNNQPMLQLGELLSNWILQHNAGEKDAGDKTLTGAMNAVRDEAKKHQSGGCACVSDTDALTIALRYFRIDNAGAAAPAAKLKADALDLDALLGEV